MSTPTIRRYPRSLAQAFPREHADPIEFFPAPSLRRYGRALICLAAAAAIGLLAALGA